MKPDLYVRKLEAKLSFYSLVFCVYKYKRDDFVNVWGGRDARTT
jgi:hypothetical protein